MKLSEEARMIELSESFTRRQCQVIALVGGQGLTYSDAAVRLGHAHQDDAHISPETVRKYAAEIRDLVGATCPPRRALWELSRLRNDWLETT